MSNKAEITFCVDTLIVETLASSLRKNAQVSSALHSALDTVKNYVGNHIDPDDRSGSLLNLVIPGAISVLLGGWFGTLAGLALRVLNIDFRSILSSIYNKIKSAISGDKKISSSNVDSIVNSAVQEHAGQEQEGGVPLTVKQQLRDAQLLKLAMLSYEQDIFNGTTKTAGIFGPTRARYTSVLARVLGWIFKVAIASAGLMVAGDVVNKFIGRPNAIDNTIQKGKPVVSAPPPTSTQTTFKLNPSYHEESYNSGEDNWIERIPNTKSGIDNMIVNFAKQVYQGLDSLDSQIKSLPTFQRLSDEIAWYNHASAGDPIVFLPRMFHSKKQVVDYFMDQLAQNQPNA